MFQWVRQCKIFKGNVIILSPPVVLINLVDVHIFFFLNIHTLYTYTQDNIMEIVLQLDIFSHSTISWISFRSVYVYVQEQYLTLYYHWIYTVLVKFSVFSNVYDYFHFIVYEFPISQRKILTDLKKN